MTKENNKDKAPQRQHPKGRNGEATIYQRKSDNRYVGNVTGPNGKRLFVYGNTHQEALAKRKALQKKLDEGNYVDPSKRTLADYLDYWLDIHSLAIKETTVQTYRGHIEANIKPRLGNIRLQQVTSLQIQRLIKTLFEEDKLKSGTVRLIYTILNIACKAAIKWKILAVNPCQDVILPREEKHDYVVLLEDEAHAFVQTVNGHRLECFFILALTIGLRRGELLGLRWKDIDFEHNHLKINRTLTHVNGRGYKETTPKTASSVRTIKLPQIAVTALQEHKTRQEVESQKAPIWEDPDLVFTNATGSYLFFTYIQETFKKIVTKAGLPSRMRVHDLRHNAATILIAKGVPHKVVQEILGHADIKTTLNIYGHVLPKMQEDAMKNMDDYFKKTP